MYFVNGQPKKLRFILSTVLIFIKKFSAHSYYSITVRLKKKCQYIALYCIRKYNIVMNIQEEDLYFLHFSLSTCMCTKIGASHFNTMGVRTKK